ncbi:MAG: DUF58 domain-containing protein [Candidatus Tectomicrobia bacterium]
MRIVPTPRLIRFLIYGAPLWLVAVVIPPGFVLGAAYLLVLVCLCARELRGLPQSRALQVRRDFPPRFSLHAVQEISLTIHNGSDTWIRIRLRDELPAALAPITPSLEGTLGPQQTTQLRYQVRSLRRGLHVFGHVVMRLEHQFGLLQRQIHFPVRDEIKIYPQFVHIQDYALLAKIDQRDEVVRRPRRIRGSGMDFESLRPYIPGEDVRKVDWKASARRGTLISRNLQVERGQQLAVLIDAGRLMTESIGLFSRFEYALNAAVMLSYVAQKRGDSIAVATFSNRIESFLPPTRGQSIVPRVLESLYRVEPRPLESDYWQVLAEMMARLKRRSLVIMLTDVLDAAGSSGLMMNLVRAATKHLVLCVVIETPRLAETAEAVPRDLEQTYLKAAASQVQLQRHLALEHMRSKGILVLETGPEHFSIQLVRRYLEIRQGDLQ